MTYSELIGVKEQFKNSVNIEYDLMDFKKLAEYIPTEDICEVIKYYFDCIEDSHFNRATILEGPYGKGKSYLVLSLIQLMLLDSDEPNVETFLSNLEKVNKDIYEQYIRIKKNHFKLLPVIINSNYSHLSQALNIALKDALERVNLSNLFPDTAFKVAHDLLNGWKRENRELAKNCSRKLKLSLNKIEQGLNEYDANSLNDFIALYNCMLKGLGLEFNPFVNEDVVKNYGDIAYKLKDHGYHGIFIVFDEFSKFIEADNNTLSNDLKILQDLAEMSTRSNLTAQMHLCCITHKSLIDYARARNKSVSNAIKTVEGRFKEVRFNRSLNQNYHLISLSLNKNKAADKLKIDDIDKYFESGLFSEETRDVISKGCFPLNPFTTFALVNISEKIAQNERTLFTFISDNDINSLSTFLKESEEGLFNVDKIYDYFAETIKKSDDGNISSICYKAETSINKTDNILAKRLLKTLAIMLIINNDLFIPTKEMIALSLDCSLEDITKVYDILEKQSILKTDGDNTIKFAISGSREVDAKLETLIPSKSKLENISTILNQIYENRFVLPRKYNTEKKMTRFYRIKYIMDFELENLNSFEYYFENEFCDGYIFRVINTKNNEQQLKNHFYKIEKNNTVLLLLTQENLSNTTKQRIYKLGALKTIANNPKDSLHETAKLIYEDDCDDLDKILNKMYKDLNNFVCINKEVTFFNHAMNQLLFDTFNKTVIVNNEMINKEIGVSSQYVKARNNVANELISKSINENTKQLDDFGSSSMEATVFNSIKNRSESMREAIDVIKNFFFEAESERKKCAEIVEKMTCAPFGIRKGVLPLFFALAMNEIETDVVFYYQSREIDLNAENINKMIENADKYYFLAEKGTQEKHTYISAMMNLFDIESENSVRTDTKNICEAMRRWIMSQSNLVRSVTVKNNYLNISTEFIYIKNYLSGFNINAHEFIFEKLPSQFNCNFTETVNSLRQIKNSISTYVDEYVKSIADDLKITVDSDSHSSLYNAIKDWLNKVQANQKILEDNEKAFVSCFENENFNDYLLLNDISKSLFGINITDWNNDKKRDIINVLAELKSNISFRKLKDDVVLNKPETNLKNDEKEISPMGEMMKNNIESVLEEFGDSISNDEKISILTSLISKIL